MCDRVLFHFIAVASDFLNHRYVKKLIEQAEKQIIAFMISSQSSDLKLL